MLYLHGGGYVVGGPEVAAPYLQRLADGTGRRVVSARYRLAPEHSPEEALADASAALDHLLNSGCPASEVVVVGDSAGGGLALRLLQLRRDQGAASLAGAILGSPWVDLASTRLSAETDYLSPLVLKRWALLVSESPEDPAVSPGRADLGGLCPMLILVGEHECFAADIHRLAQDITAAGGNATLVEGAAGVHCWYLMPGLPGPVDTLSRIQEHIDLWLPAS